MEKGTGKPKHMQEIRLFSRLFFHCFLQVSPTSHYVNEHMLLVVKTRLCFVTLASRASASMWIVLSGRPPSREHKTGRACFPAFNAPLLRPFPSWEHSGPFPLSSWQMVSVLHLLCLTLTNYVQLMQLPLALPSTVTPEHASNFSR